MTVFDQGIETFPRTFPKLRRYTSRVHPDEPAWVLSEVTAMAPDQSGQHRYQIIEVNRDGVMTRYTEDLGPVEWHRSPTFSIPALWEHTVGELKDIADVQRLGPNKWVNFLAEKQAESTMLRDSVRFKEATYKAARNQSSFGPFANVQRNGVPSRVAQKLR